MSCKILTPSSDGDDGSRPARGLLEAVLDVDRSARPSGCPLHTTSCASQDVAALAVGGHSLPARSATREDDAGSLPGRTPPQLELAARADGLKGGGCCEGR